MIKVTFGKNKDEDLESIQLEYVGTLEDSVDVLIQTFQYSIVTEDWRYDDYISLRDTFLKDSPNEKEGIAKLFDDLMDITDNPTAVDGKFPKHVIDWARANYDDIEEESYRNGLLLTKVTAGEENPPF